MPLSESFLGRCHTRDALQVVNKLHLVPAFEQPLHAVRKGSADLHHQPAPWFKRRVGLRDEPIDDLQPRGAGKNRIARLEFADFELHLVFL